MGAGAAAGGGIAVAGMFLTVYLATMGRVHNYWLVNLPLLVPIAAGIVMLFFAQTRRFATGMLIVVFSTWILVVGPCTSGIH